MNNWMPKNPIGTFVQPHGDGQRWAYEKGGRAYARALMAYLKEQGHYIGSPNYSEGYGFFIPAKVIQQIEEELK